MDFNQLVEAHYRGLFQLALSLARSEADAADLTQETFLRWAEKGSQLRDTTKAKSWLYTTLYRQFLGRQRHVTRFPHDEMRSAAWSTGCRWWNPRPCARWRAAM